MSLRFASTEHLILREAWFPDGTQGHHQVLGVEKRNQAPWGNVVKRNGPARILGAAGGWNPENHLDSDSPQGFWAEGQSSINGRRWKRSGSADTVTLVPPSPAGLCPTPCLLQLTQSIVNMFLRESHTVSTASCLSGGNERRGEASCPHLTYAMLVDPQRNHK